MSGESKHINKSAIRTFAIEARKILMKSAATEAGLYGISAEEIRKPVQRGLDFEVYETMAGTEKRIFRADMRRRANLVKAIEDKGFQEVIEETAYTWFNRLIAIRFMEVNDYLPTRTRVLSSETGNNTPDLINEFLDVDLGMTEEEMQAVQSAKNENRYDDAFRLLFIKECNALNDVLPGLFEKTDDYMELLLNLPYTSDGVVRMLIDTIPEENFDVEKEGQIEIIGWLYQYYNTEPKAKAFAKKEKITKEEIPAVTQLFTPDWIVRYMVENSLGRLWIEGHPDEDLKSNWKYYLNEAPQEPEVEKQLAEIREGYKKLTPEDIKVIDPCMGSGHILVYLFEVLMQIYKQDGYTERDAAELILENNLYGLDIDDRAYQLSYFAVVMKARQYNRSILKKCPKCHIYAVQESNGINKNQLEVFGTDLSEIERNNAKNQLEGLIDTFIDGKEYGSILKVEMCDWELLRKFVASDSVEGQITFATIGMDQTRERLEELIDIGEIMAQKYEVVVTNPPYAAVSNLSEKLNVFVKKNYPDSKSDLFAVFIERCGQMTVKSGYQAMITQHAWMFLSSFEKLRRKMMLTDTVNMAHLGTRAFEEIGGEVVQTTSFVRCANHVDGYKGTYCRLTEPTSQQGKEKMFLEGENLYAANQDNFEKIPGGVIAYWSSDAMQEAFSNQILYDVARPRQGMATTNNDMFLRLWPEVSFKKMGVGCTSTEDALETKKKWFPVTKGGVFRRWYGNFDYVVNYENSGKTICDYIDSTPGAKVKSNGRVINRDLFFHKGMTWSTIASGPFGMRYVPNGFIFETKGSMCFTSDDLLNYILGLYNSPVIQCFLQMVSPTLDYHEGPVGKTPVIIKKNEQINQLVEENVEFSRTDWNSYETSWDFKEHPFVWNAKGLWDATAVGASMHMYYSCHPKVNSPIELCYMLWKRECAERFQNLKKNEEELNRIFIDIYSLQDELTPDVADKDVTVHRIFDTKDDVPESMKGSNYVRTMRDEIVSFISYAVGCMFGRYSLDKEGLAYAGGEWDASQYSKFQPDEDAIIPITDEDYGFGDDIVEKFIAFVRAVYGEETLEDNLEFIAKALGNKGNSYREVLRNYFINDFYKDHCNTYSVTGSGKRPIYWLFDSGKQNGFKALLYMHRYTPDTVGQIRSVYLHKVQAAIETAKQNAEYIISTSSSATEKAAASKKRDKYIKQLNELRPYYQALSHVALQRIDMDLDNGVKANYHLFQNVEISTEGKKQKIDLLAKI